MADVLIIRARKSKPNKLKGEPLIAPLFERFRWAIYPLLFLLGLAGVGFGGIYFTIISEFGGQYGAGRTAGLANTVSIGGSILGPVTFGYIVDISDSYELAWVSLALMAAVCVFLLLFVREWKRKI